MRFQRYLKHPDVQIEVWNFEKEEKVDFGT